MVIRCYPLQTDRSGQGIGGDLYRPELDPSRNHVGGNHYVLGVAGGEGSTFVESETMGAFIGEGATSPHQNIGAVLKRSGDKLSFENLRRYRHYRFVSNQLAGQNRSQVVLIGCTHIAGGFDLLSRPTNRFV